MLLRIKYNFNRSYYMVASGREYRVNRIHFYKDNAILVSTSNGWLENSKGFVIGSIKLPIDEIKVKRKVNFNGEIFAISKGKDWFRTDLTANLYIPAEILNIHFVGNKIECHSDVVAIYKGYYDIHISSYVKPIDEELYSIRHQYEEIYERVHGFDLSIRKPEDVLADIDRLKKLAEDFIEERKRIHNLTIDDIKI